MEIGNKEPSLSLARPNALRVVDWPAVRAGLAQREELRLKLVGEGQKLFARIRPSSKYHGQGGSKKNGEIFPVAVLAEPEYPVKGGPGGQYRLVDVDLFVESEPGKPPVQITFEVAP